MTAQPSVSVVVALISGKTPAVRRCLAALSAQEEPSADDIIVPYDDPCADVTTLVGEFPQVRFIHAADLDSAAGRLGASREHHDVLRTLGIRAAGGDIIALTEDHAHLDRHWCREMVAALHRHETAAAVGGAVDCDSPRQLNWAVWFCDFGRYQNPLPEKPAQFVSDSNVAYRRSALERVASAWDNNYHETVVHDAMVEAGYEIWTTPLMVAWQARSDLLLTTALRERLVWGRSYAGTRVKSVGLPKRAIFALLTPALPLLLTWRIYQVTAERKRHRSRFFRALPIIVLLQLFWALGELIGYVTADPG